MNDVKDASPYGKSTSSSFKFMSSEDGLRRAGGCYRLVFGFAMIVFCEYCGLNRAVLLSKKYEHENDGRLPYRD
jgi:hypothetical protein